MIVERAFADKSKIDAVLDAIKYELEVENEEEAAKKIDELRNKIEEVAEKVDVNAWEREIVTNLKVSARQMVENVRAAIAIRRAVEKLDDEGVIDTDTAARIGAEAEELLKRNLKWAAEQHSMAETLMHYGLRMHGGSTDYVKVLAVPVAFVVALRIIR